MIAFYRSKIRWPLLLSAVTIAECVLSSSQGDEDVGTSTESTSTDTDTSSESSSDTSTDTESSSDTSTDTDTESSSDTSSDTSTDTDTDTDCTSHHECPGNAGCHILEGTCLSEDNVVEVEAGGELNAALDSLGGVSGTLLLAAAPATFTVDDTIGSIELADGQVVAIVAPAAAPPRISMGDFSTMFRIGSNQHLYIEGVYARTVNVIVVSGTGTVYLDSVRARGTFTSVSATDSAELWIRNSMITSENAEDSDTMYVGPLATVHVTYSTIIAPSLSEDGHDTLTCAAGSSGEIRNSIVGSMIADDGLNCEGSEIDFVDNMLEVAMPNNDVVPGGSLSPSWFVDKYDYHITPGLDPFPFNVAQFVPGPPPEGDPDYDFDGDPRVTAPARLVAGADASPP